TPGARGRSPIFSANVLRDPSAHTPGFIRGKQTTAPLCVEQWGNPRRGLTRRKVETYARPRSERPSHAGLRTSSMRHHKSAGKRVGTNELRRQRNVAATTRMRSAIKTVRVATTRAAGEAALKQTRGILDSTAAK